MSLILSLDKKGFSPCNSWTVTLTFFIRQSPFPSFYLLGYQCYILEKLEASELMEEYFFRAPCLDLIKTSFFAYL